MELEKTESGRDRQVFDVCNAYLKALLSGDKDAIEKAARAWYDLGKNDNKEK